MITVLYVCMNNKDNYKVTEYIARQDELFLYRIHIAFDMSFVLCIIAF